MTPPVLLTIWRRPEATRRVLDRVREAQPGRLLIAGDGPGADADRATVMATRRLVEAGVDWDCDVETLYRDRNRGCRAAMSEALDWFFERVPEGIVLEDDCVPHRDFFGYCAELLDRYRDDDRVLHIGGDNSSHAAWGSDDSYRFVRWSKVWGWASWRRAWQQYDRDLHLWRARTRGGRARRVLPDRFDREVWVPRFERLRTEGRPDTWDYQWIATGLLHDGLAIVPRVNLVTNVGFGPEATHTRRAASPLAEQPTGPILPLHHPDTVALDEVTDRHLLLHSHGGLRVQRRRRPPALGRLLRCRRPRGTVGLTGRS